MAATVIPGCLAAMALVTSVHAESLPDPTRPPLAVLAPASAPGDATERMGGLVLQSVLIAPDRRSAVISGQSMALGDTVGGFRLVRVAVAEVTLEGLEGSRTLSLFPDVRKRKPHGADQLARSGSGARHGKR